MHFDQHSSFEISLDPNESPELQIKEALSNLPPVYCSLHPEERVEIDVHETIPNCLKAHDGKLMERALVSTRLPDNKITILPCMHSCRACLVHGYLGVPKIHASDSFENFRMVPPELKPYWEKCSEYAENRKGVLLMIGKPGSGKTHLAVSILKRVLYPDCALLCPYDRPRRMLFISHMQLLQAHRKNYSIKHSVNEEDTFTILDECKSADFFVLDELKAPTGARDDQILIEDLLCHRIENFMPSVITTNLTREELKVVYGEGLYDRLRQALFSCLEFDFPSKRASLNKDYLLLCGKR